MSLKNMPKSYTPEELAQTAVTAISDLCFLGCNGRQDAVTSSLVKSPSK